jgi:hypothetical protein
MYTEIIHYDAEIADKAVGRGQRIALSERMPPPISTDPSWYQCKFCDAHNFCHESKTTKYANCRTCANATPLADSTWHCAKWEDIIPIEAQHTGCDSHVLHPDLVPWQRKESDDEWQAIYVIDGKEVKNGIPGPGVYSSNEILANHSACTSNDEGIEAFRAEFNARVTG